VPGAPGSGRYLFVTRVALAALALYVGVGVGAVVGAATATAINACRAPECDTRSCDTYAVEIVREGY